MSGCGQCGKNKNLILCSCCETHICKNCCLFVEPTAFHYASEKPALLDKGLSFCSPCYEEHLSDALLKDQQTIEAAKQIHIFEKQQSKETRLLNRHEKPLIINHALDQEDAFLKLAYQAVLKGFNCVVDVDVKGKKVRDGSYQTTDYSATGIPTQVTDRKLIKDRSIWSNPN